MMLLLGTSHRGPAYLGLTPTDWDLLGDEQYNYIASMTLTTLTSISSARSYRFLGYTPVNYWETSPKPTGEGSYRLKGFPVTKGAFTISLDGDLLSRSLTTPSTGEYYLDEDSGLLKLGDSPTNLIVSYTANTGRLREIEPLDFTDSGSEISWGSTDLLGEAWVEVSPEHSEGSLQTCFEHGSFSESNSLAVRCNGGTPALCTIAASSLGTIVLQAEVGTEGNGWRACWDTDAIYILRPPGHRTSRLVIPLTVEAASYLKKDYYDTVESLQTGLPSYFKELSIPDLGGTTSVMLTASTLINFSGGTDAAVDWDSALRFLGLDGDYTTVPLGLTIATVSESFLAEAKEMGQWPVVVMGSESEISGSDGNLAAIMGTAIYTDGYVGSPLAGFAGALSRGNPYIMPTISSCSPIGDNSTLIYAVESVRYGWMVTRQPMVSGSLFLNHQLWLQNFVSSIRGILEKYIGKLGIKAVEIGNDPDLVAVMESADAEYTVSVGSGSVLVSTTVTPPGAIGEVSISVSRN